MKADRRNREVTFNQLGPLADSAALIGAIELMETKSTSPSRRRISSRPRGDLVDHRASAPSSRAHNPDARNLTGRRPAAWFVPLVGGLIPDGDVVDGIENH
jgi:hypothetical protein